jgi:acyl-CoA dehydrogenase
VQFVEELRCALRDAVAFAEAANEEDEMWVRQAVTALYHASSAALLAFEGCETALRRGDARRALWARLVLDHRFHPRGALTRSDRGRERAIAAALLGDAPMSHAAIAPLLAR